MISVCEAILLINQIIIFATLGWFASRYIRLKRRVRIALRKMNCDDLLDQLMDDGVGTTGAGQTLPPRLGTTGNQMLPEDRQDANVSDSRH